MDASFLVCLVRASRSCLPCPLSLQHHCRVWLHFPERPI